MYRSVVNSYNIRIESLTKDIEISSAKISQLEENGALKKEITSETKTLKSLQRELKAVEKDKSKYLGNIFLSIKEFFNSIVSYNSFETIMKHSIDQYEEKKDAKFYLHPVQPNIIQIYPDGLEDMFMKTFIQFEISEENMNPFTSWVLSSNKDVAFTLDDYTLFRKLATSAGTTGTKMVVDDFSIDSDEFCLSGYFYHDGNLGIGWEYSLHKITRDLVTFPEDFQDKEIHFDALDNLNYTENGVVIIEMPSDMIRIFQKGENTKYFVHSEPADENGFASVTISSCSEDNLFKIYQVVNVIQFDS